MPHHPKPFFRSGRGWYVQLGKSQIKLADGPENAATEAAAWEQYHQVMAERNRPKGEAKTPSPSTCPSVAEVFDKYLAWCQQHRAPRTYEWYQEHIQDFVNFQPAVARLPADQLRPFHVVEWSDSKGEAWSNAYRRGAIVAVQRPFNWAVELGYLAASPIRRIPKPQPQRREQVVSPEEWATIRDRYADGDPFRDILEFGWETGCRPQEAKRIEARHVDLEARRVVFPPAEAKGKRRWRVILLTARAEAIVRRRLAQYPEGRIFRNEDGLPWTAQAMSCRFGRLKKRLGVKYAAYSIRHGFCQRLLEDGNDHLTVAALMGHATGKMVAETYSHMNRADAHLRDALTRGSAGAGG